MFSRVFRARSSIFGGVIGALAATGGAPGGCETPRRGLTAPPPREVHEGSGEGAVAFRRRGDRRPSAKTGNTPYRPSDPSVGSTPRPEALLERGAPVPQGASNLAARHLGSAGAARSRHGSQSIGLRDRNGGAGPRPSTGPSRHLLATVVDLKPTGDVRRLLLPWSPLLPTDPAGHGPPFRDGVPG